MFLDKVYEIKKYVNNHSNLILERDDKTVFINFTNLITKNEINELLKELWKNRLEIGFHDTIHPTLSDPGAYFRYSTEKTIGEEYWSMTYGNHGWSGGIYHLKRETISQQIYNLVDKGEINKIQITEVVFFSHYEIKSKEKSDEMDNKIRLMHE